MVKNADKVVTRLTDTRHNSDGTQNDTPARGYIANDGSWVVVTEDGDVVQVSDKNEAYFPAPSEKPDFDGEITGQ